MTLRLETPTPDEMIEVLDVLGSWQRDDLPMQLHPGDLGWFARFGSDTAAAATRVWRREGEIVAVGLLDGDDLLRLATSPRLDRQAAPEIVSDITSAGLVLPAGPVVVEAPTDHPVHDGLRDHGWAADEVWTILARDLADPVETSTLSIEALSPTDVETWAAVMRASFAGSSFSAERWYALSRGPAAHQARTLLARDATGEPVAGAIVWSAGTGRPGILEPLGVVASHRGRGHGTAMAAGAAAALREMGASSAQVATPGSNAAAVGTYLAAGFAAQPARQDTARPA